jgi:predicted dithiol-disulfide oxidoreductase (DUF899 family)
MLQLRPSESLPTHRDNNTGNLLVTLFHTTLKNFSNQNVPGSQIKTAYRWRNLQQPDSVAQLFLSARGLFTYTKCFVRCIPASWLLQCVRKVAVHLYKVLEVNPQTIVGKNWTMQLHSLPVLHFNRCLTAEYSETAAHFNGNFDTDNQIYVP